MILRLGVRRSAGEAAVILVADSKADASDIGPSLDLGEVPLARVDFGGTPHELPTHGTVAESGLLDGDMVEVARPGEMSASNTPPARTPSREVSRWALTVRAGVDAGRTLPLANGAQTLGRSSDCDLQLDDLNVSRLHATIEVKRNVITIEDENSSHGTTVDGGAARGRTKLRPGSRITMGNTSLELVARERDEHSAGTSSIGAALERDGRGGLLLNRVPSRRTPPSKVTVTLPRSPSSRERRGVPWLPSLLPVALAAVIAWTTGERLFLLFALLGPLTLVATAVSNRWADKRADKRSQKKHREAGAAVHGRISEALAKEVAWRRESGPSGVECADIAVGRSRRLWERSPGDVDYLDVRVGQGRMPAAISIEGSDEPSPELPDVPLCPNLIQAGVLGIAGRSSDRTGITRSIVVQLATLHASDELHIALLSENAPEAEWGLFRWLPHTWSPGERKVDVAQGGEEIGELVGRLLKVVEERRENRWDTRQSSSQSHVVILDGVATLRQRPAVAELLATGPAYGIYAVALDAEARLLPEECRVQVSVEGTQIRVTGLPERNMLVGTSDVLDSALAVRASRALAPLRRVGGLDASATALPDQLTLFELLGFRPDLTSVRQRWLKPSSTNVPVGRDLGGVLSIDIVQSGPHALVAGTSGMGKSELIQTWVTSLAVHNRPDDLAFLFVEYKGLSAFLRLKDLPHCAGTITNLTAELMSRALASLRAETRRRQDRFHGAGVPDFAGYQHARREDPELEPMPRLLIVMDEFAELKQNHPTFIEDLISVARTGRSLGVHLILATQQVARAVSPEIAGNSTIRISLRAQSPEDSLAILDSKVANSLPLAIKGRAFVRRGESAPAVFQTAWSGAPVDSTERAVITAMPWAWRPDEMRFQTTFGANPTPVSEMSDVVEVLSDTAAEMGIPKPRRPFTEPLREEVPILNVMEQAPVGTLQDLVEHGGPVVGAHDDLQLQLHTTYSMPLLRGHVAVIGDAQSGRTTAIRTTLGSWAQVMPPSMFQFHVIDSGRGLTALNRLPHAGTHTTPDDNRLPLLLRRLTAEINTRLERLEAEGMGDLVELWDAPGTLEPIPWIVLVVDRFEDLLARVERTSSEASLERLLSHGLAAGVTVLAVGDDTLMRSRWLARFSHRIVLRYSGGVDVTAAGLPRHSHVGSLPNGRCLIAPGGHLVQIAHLGRKPTTADQNQAVRDLAGELEARWTGLEGRTPLRIRDLPTKIATAALPEPSAPDTLVLGLGGDAAEPVELEKQDLPLLVVGPDVSDRTAVLERLASRWSNAGHAVLIVGNVSSTLARSAPGNVTMVTGEGHDWLQSLNDPNVAVLVDDLNGRDLPDDLVLALERSVPRDLFAASMGPAALVPAPIKALVRSGSLLYLSPGDVRNVEYFGVEVEPSICVTHPRGRGALVSSRRQVAVQVALDL